MPLHLRAASPSGHLGIADSHEQQGTSFGQQKKMAERRGWERVVTLNN
jgi:hypothetical protein